MNITPVKIYNISLDEKLQETMKILKELANTPNTILIPQHNGHIDNHHIALALGRKQ